MKCFQIGQIECMANPPPRLSIKTDGKPEIEAKPI